VNKAAVIRVAINAPLSRLFDYLPADDGEPLPGCRVLVPFGRQKQIGLVMELASHSDLPASKLKKAIAILDDSPLLDEADRWLINFTSDYYHHPVGEVVAAALPALLRQGKPLVSLVSKIAATAEGAMADLNVMRKRAPRQAALLTIIRDADTISFEELDQAMPGWRRLKKNLVDKSLIEEFETSDDSDELETLANVEHRRRHRQRQNGDLPALDPRHDRWRPPGAGTGSRDRPNATAGQEIQDSAGTRAGPAAFGTDGHGAACRVARGTGRRGTTDSRYAVCRVRPDENAGPDHRRRRARQLTETTGRAALLRS
jgi:hypothetical protein